MKGFGLPRSPAVVLLLLRPLLASGDSASRPQARAMNPGGGGGGGGGGGAARGSPEVSHRLQRSIVPGSDPQRCNELLLLMDGEGAAPGPRHHVLYFPGDVQLCNKYIEARQSSEVPDLLGWILEMYRMTAHREGHIFKNYHEIMTRHPENYQWENWSLENVATILARRFPNSYIWVIKCSRMHLHKFSCYDNFVKSNMFGAPEHNPDFGAFKHLYMLLVNAFKLSQNGLLSKNSSVWNKDCKASNCQSNSTPTNGGPEEKEGTCDNAEDSAVRFAPLSLNGASFTLIGFSKGCVVLNQLLFELKEAKKDKNVEAFIRSIRAMYWLDGGHSGGSNTWVTYPDVLKEFAQTGITVYTHVTPYQVHDPMRSWIGKEHRKFVQILGDLGVQVTSQIHFAKETPSIENHFRVHEVFRGYECAP